MQHGTQLGLALNIDSTLVSRGGWAGWASHIPWACDRVWANDILGVSVGMRMVVQHHSVQGWVGEKSSFSPWMECSETMRSELVHLFLHPGEEEGHPKDESLVWG